MVGWTNVYVTHGIRGVIAASDSLKSFSLVYNKVIRGKNRFRCLKRSNRRFVGF